MLGNEGKRELEERARKRASKRVKVREEQWRVIERNRRRGKRNSRKYQKREIK